MVKLVSYLQSFDDIYNELCWNEDAKRVLDEIRNEGDFTQELAFEAVETHFSEGTSKDLRLFVTDRLHGLVKNEKKMLRDWLDDFNRNG